MAGKKKRTDADPIETDDVQPDTPIADVTAAPEPEREEDL